MPRFIAIGDVHGCHEELEKLLDSLNPGPEDKVIQLGDLVNRGPNSGRCIALMREVNALCLLGNHERRLLRYHWSKDESILKKYDYETLKQLSDEDWDFLEGMPLFHHEPYMQTVFVHAGFLPGSGVPWNQQSAEILAHIQVIDENGQPQKRSACPQGTPWGESWEGPPFVVYGHTPRERVFRTRWTLGIDTACVYGGFLTACVFPGMKITQVRAKSTYAFSKTLPQPVNSSP